MYTAVPENALQYSPYLREIAARFPSPRPLDICLSAVEAASASNLLDIKAEFSLQFSRTTFQDFDEMGRLWTQFADATIERALTLAWERVCTRHKISFPTSQPSGLFILGLGKLGGFDLNFSSDVDLIAFYDADVLPVPAHKGQAHIASEVCKQLTQILQPRNVPDHIWRVDWRLRPESSGTGLAISTSKAETFYFFRSLPWHRLALMKARPVAGDISAGTRFMEDLEPFIWRRNLDYSTIDELAALKTRINNEHPGLETERAAPEPITPQATGFNLKLGRGGIREIEFIANAQQLILGGKRPTLRVTNTRAALSELSELGLLTKSDADALRDHYAYFRRIENAVQMRRNEQTHIIPDGTAGEDLLKLTTDDAVFDDEIAARRHMVHSKFNDLFADVSDEVSAVDLTELDEAPARIAQSWAEGFKDHGIAASSAQKYTELGRTLVGRIQKLHRPEAFERVDSFLRQLGRSEQYFTLLNHHPHLLDMLVTPLLHSPHMSEILRQSPHIIDIFLSPETSNLQEQSAFVLTSPDYERRLEALRRFVNEQLFKSYTGFLEGRITATTLQTRLTQLAEETLSLSMRIIADDLKVSELPMTILGLGKMGTGAMAPQSDLDLIFLFADDCDPELSAKAVRRMRTTLTTKLREGIAYELDTRLRPSGRSGPPAVKLSAFRDHHMKRAHSWEHIALAPARIVAGDGTLGRQVMSIKAEIMARPRDIDAFKADAWAMFERLAEERFINTPTDTWRTKLRRGGLMETDYMSACLTVTGQTLPPALSEASDVWNTMVIWERLLGMTGRPLADTPSRFSDQIRTKKQPKHWKALETQIQKITKAFFKNQSGKKSPDPRPIIWKS